MTLKCVAYNVKRVVEGDTEPIWLLNGPRQREIGSGDAFTPSDVAATGF